MNCEQYRTHSRIVKHLGQAHVRTPHGEEISTEMDVAENSQPGSPGSNHSARRNLKLPQLALVHSIQYRPFAGISHRQSYPARIYRPIFRAKNKSQAAFPEDITNRCDRGPGVISGYLVRLSWLIWNLVQAWTLRFFPGQNPTVLPSLTATQTSNVQDIVLFSDDFSNPLSGWPTIQNAQGGYSYQADGYHIFVDEIGAVLWAKTETGYANSSVYVDARPVIEGTNGYYGLLCRIQQDEQNFYYFVIQGNGDYTIGKYKNAEFQSLFSEGGGKAMRSIRVIKPIGSRRIV